VLVLGECMFGLDFLGHDVLLREAREGAWRLAFLAVCDRIFDDTGHMIIGQGVDDFSSRPRRRDQIGPLEQPQVLGDQGLRQLGCLSQRAHGRGLVGKRAQDEKPRWSGQGLEQLRSRERAPSSEFT
jgi:hypothetical protein